MQPTTIVSTPAQLGSFLKKVVWFRRVGQDEEFLFGRMDSMIHTCETGEPKKGYIGVKIVGPIGSGVIYHIPLSSLSSGLEICEMDEVDSRVLEFPTEYSPQVPPERAALKNM